jgi:site-specific recombinase XerC
MTDPWVVEFLAQRQARGDSAKTLAIRTHWLAQLTWARGELAWERLTRAELERWHQQLLWQPGHHGRLYSPHTVDQALLTARLFFRWAVADGRLREDPMAGWLLRGLPPAPRRLLSREEVARLLAAPGPDPLGLRDRALLELLGLGLAPAACAALDLADLDRGEGLLRVRRPRLETLRLGPVSREHLERYLLLGRPALIPQDPAFLLGERGRRLTSPAVSERLRRHARAAGLRVTARQLARTQAELRERFLQRRLFPLAEDR